MKRFLTLMTIAASAVMLMSGCTNDPKPVVEKKLDVNTKTLTFDHTGGTQTLTVTAENVEWDFTASDTWITVAADENNDKKLNVTLGTFDGESQEGTIKLFAEGVDDVTVTVTQTGPEAPELSIDTTEESISAEGGDLSFVITIANMEIADVEIESDKGWLTFTQDGTAVTAHVAKNTEADPRTGVITVSAPDVTDVTFTVTQGGAIIWERSQAARLNLKGNVKSVSYIDLVSAATIGGTSITDVQFNEKGMITAYSFTSGNSYNATITYDESDRISVITGTKTTGNPGTYTITLTYGTHGMYMPAQDMLDDIMSAYPCNHKLVVPALIKDLAGIACTYTVGNGTNITYTVDSSESPYKVAQTYGTDTIDDYMKIVFEDGYVEGIQATLRGNEISYAINTTTGIMSSWESTGISNFRYEYNDDQINSVKTLISMSTGGASYPLTFEYNTNLDVIKASNPAPYSFFEGITYTYDTDGNWTSRTGGGPLQAKTRTITYYE